MTTAAERPLIFLTKGLLLLKLLFKLILIIIEESEGENSLNDFEKSRALAIIYVRTNLAKYVHSVVAFSIFYESE